MSVTLQQLRDKVSALLREDSTNTHFTDTVLNGFLNEAAEFAAVFIEYPRDIVAVTVENNIGSYSNPADNLLLRTAYFGSSGNITKVNIVSEETLREIYPNWLDPSTSMTADRPQYLMQIDRNTVHIIPRPNSVAAGKSLYLNYNYVPASMSNDSDTPDLPLPYHNLLPLYALHLCYYALQNIPVSEQFYKDFMEKINRLKSAVTKESKENLSFMWGNTEDVNTNSFDGGIIP